MKKIIYILFVSLFLLTGCLDDLDQYPNIETTSSDVYKDASNYKAVLGKLYVAFVINGQEKGGGNSDLSSNNGQDYMRSYFNLQVRRKDIGCSHIRVAHYQCTVFPCGGEYDLRSIFLA
jgi:hypothetical protein